MVSGPVLHARRQSMLPASTADPATAVKVVVRIRPNTASSTANVPQRFQRTVLQPLSSTTLQAENAGPSTASTLSAAANASTAKYGKSAFTFDRVISPDEGQPSVYECAGPLVSSFLDGMNATILAYGQTSSGKSYTMGTDRLGVEEEADPERQGITPRAVAEIFQRLDEAQRKGGVSFSAKVSYIEIYNEELLDLLAGEADVRPTVQIREDKTHGIIWQGLREVKVSTADEVMNLLAEGSTLRQTGSTDMNAQSSRSHAIFSLTVTQRKWAGTGPPPAPSPSSPQSPRVASRLSQLPRSPAMGGRSTPTADRPGSRTGLRPPSQLGRPTSPHPDDAGGVNGGETWTTLTSKFHFVDLAGSERLKRTAAVGERQKEGISINAGLSALGNVISALGDPTKKATHIPYRDSKLTRLLQDSLGGNAKTMMIACVSPTEYNLHETLSTLKYANRARNIKNKAEINESEAGWDDIEYLRRTILKLRADLGSVRSGDASSMTAIAEEGIRRSVDGVNGGSSGIEVELQQKVAQLTADLAKAQSGAATSLSRDQFTAAVEPIVEEYERSLSALESQLALTKAALGHSEEEMQELEARIDEEAKANEASSQLIDELRVRVAKLSEREATTEAYVKDLESRLRDVDEAGDAHGLAVSELRKEITKNREQAETTELYIKEMEERLAKADESNAALRRQVEVLEREISRREEAHKELEARVSLLDTSKEQKLLLAEIDEKDRRLLELERSLDDLKTKADAAEGEAERLQRLADEEKAAKEDLEGQVRTLERAAIVRRSVPDTPPQTPGELSEGEAAANGEATPTKTAPPDLQRQLDDLQATHTSTLQELEAAQDKYRESLKEIEDLNSQVQEAKLLRSQRSFSDLSDTAASPASTTTTFANGISSASRSDELEDEDEVEELASPRPGSSRSASPASFRTTPRTPHARRSMPLSPQHRLSFLGPRGPGATSPSHLRSASLSLSQELSSVASSQISSLPSPRPVSPSPSSHGQRDSLYSASQLLPMLTPPGERSYESIKNEVFKLQTALNEREEEISVLETTIHQLRTPTIPSSTPNGSNLSPADSPIDSPVISVNVERPSTPPTTDSDDHDLNLSPRTRAAFASIKAGLNGTGLGFVNAIPPDAAVASSPSLDDEAAQADRLDDLMRSMAKKESTHREAVESLENQLSALQRQHDELTVLSRDQVVNMSSEIEQLRVELAGRPEKGALDAQLKKLEDELQRKGEELESSRRAAEESLEQAKKELMQEHERLLQSTIADHETTLQRLRDEHAAALSAAATERDDTVKRSESEESEAGALASTTQDDIASTIKRLSDEHASSLSDRQAQHDDALQRLKDEHATSLQSKDEQHLQALADLGKAHDTALAAASAGSGAEVARLRADHDSLVQRLADEHWSAIEQLKSTHEQGLTSATEEHEQRLAAAKEAHAAELASLRNEHDAALAGRSTTHSSELADLRDEHARAIDGATSELGARHAAEVEALHAKHADEVERLREEHAGASQKIADEQQALRHELEESHARALEEVEKQHGNALDRLRDSLMAEHASAVALLHEQHTAVVEAAWGEHSTALENLQSEHTAVLEQERQAHADALASASTAPQASLTALEGERDEAKAAHASLLSELDTVRADLETSKAALAASSAQHEAASQRASDLQKQHEVSTAEIANLRRSLAQQQPSSSPSATGELQEALDALGTLEKALHESQDERERLLTEVQELKGGREQGQTKYDSIFKDLEKYRASVTKLDLELVRTRKERDSFSAQLARQSLSSNAGLGLVASPTNNDSHSRFQDRTMSPTQSDLERATSPTFRSDSRFLSNGSTYSMNGKPPPPTPPPSVPPPPAPLPNAPLPPVPSNSPLRTTRSSSTSSTTQGRGSISGDTPATSIRSGTDSQSIDPRILERFKEQEAQISRLTKQLAQKEADLQSQLDLANTLDQALNDSERNLRKARLQSNEYARERDQYKADNDRLRVEAQDSHTTSESYRQSVLDMEERLQEQRNREGRSERARQELESRMAEVNRRKSKFACF
ncbi:hypothetical protein JCM10207_001008 [Rhodosporidiobolus poonsookiae]